MKEGINVETIVVKDIYKRFKISKKQQKIEHTKQQYKTACQGISFSTQKGEIFGLLGPNGAGKTTTLRIIATLIKADKGDVYVNGVDIKDDVLVKKSIAFLTNELKLEETFTPNYLFDYFSSFHGIDKATVEVRKKELFEKFGIDKFAEVKIADMSTGMKQKASIVMSLVHDPDIIIFDEPTNGLDVLTSKVVTDYLIELKNKGKTVIISTHIMSLVEKICDRVGIIIDGKMIECDTLDNIYVKHQKDDLEDIFFDIYKEMKGDEENA